MSWRDVVTNWLSNKKDLTLLDLLQEMIQADMIRDMIEANMIPATLIDNQTLHSILLTQVILETLMDLSVPPVNNFTHNANRRGKEMILWDLNRKNAEQMKSLEEQTGVNLDHYHKLNIENSYIWSS